VSIKAACIRCQDLYLRTARLRIFMRPMACSLPLLIKGLANQHQTKMHGKVN
jgi:hypothetical protein